MQMSVARYTKKEVRDLYVDGANFSVTSRSPCATSRALATYQEHRRLGYRESQRVVSDAVQMAKWRVGA